MDETIQIEMQKATTELKSTFLKQSEEIKLLGSAQDETKKAFAAIEEKINVLDLTVSKMKYGGGAEPEAVKTAGQRILENAEYMQEAKSEFPSLRSKNGRLMIPIDGKFLPDFNERKSVITTTSGLTVGTTGVQLPTRLPGITGIAMQALRIRDLMTRRTTTTSSFDYVKQQTRTNAASPQTEGSAKAESTYAWNSAQGTVQEIAHFVNVTKQSLADVPYLQTLLNTELMYGLELQLEAQLLLGDGIGSHLNGILTQATAYDTATYNVSGDTKLDKLRHAKLQARLAGLATYAPDCILMHPTDLHAIELIKDETGGTNKGRYIIGDPRQGTQIQLLWGLPVVETDSIAAGKFLVGCMAQCEFIDREQAVIEISYEHASNFTANLATIRAEMRAGIAVRVPTVNIYGPY